jgi:hypothetical protein
VTKYSRKHLKRRKDIFGSISEVSVHGQLAPLSLSQNETEYHDEGHSGAKLHFMAARKQRESTGAMYILQRHSFSALFLPSRPNL